MHLRRNTRCPRAPAPPTVWPPTSVAPSANPYFGNVSRKPLARRHRRSGILRRLPGAPCAPPGSPRRRGGLNGGALGIDIRRVQRAIYVHGGPEQIQIAHLGVL